MDRRAALKKLGVGSAVAVGAPLVLPGFNVAAGTSPPPPTLDVAGGGIIGLSFPVTISNASDFPAGTQFQWSESSAQIAISATTGTSVNVSPTGAGVLPTTRTGTITVTPVDSAGTPLGYHYEVDVSMTATTSVLLLASVTAVRGPLT